MNRFFPILVGLLILAGGPAVAKEKAFFLAQDVKTKKCKVVTTKPDGAGLVMIGDSSYSTKKDAKAAAKNADECSKPKKAEASNAN
jgi:predicted glutamine amidotransferase